MSKRIILLSAAFALLAASQASAQHSPPLDPPLVNWEVAPAWSPAPSGEESKTTRQLVHQGSGNDSAKPLTFVAITPCRLLDTRVSSGMTGDFGPPSLIGDPGQNGTISRVIPVAGSSCGVPAAAAYSLNFVLIPPAGGIVEFLSAWPAGQAWPGTAVLSALEGGIVQNSAIIPASSNGGIQVMATRSTDLVIDINGYFAPTPPLDFQGPWNGSASYSQGQVVSYAGSSYVAVAANQGVDPANDVSTGSRNWAVLARAGAAGPEGAPGDSGPPGPMGPAGAPGTAGPPGPPATFEGPWDPLSVYPAGAAVSYDGSSYVSLTDGNTGNTPTDGPPWAVLAQQGLQGPEGPPGPEGIQGIQGIQGEIGPAGPQGIQGPAGSTGPQGPPVSFQGTWSPLTIYSTGDAVFYDGSSYISLSSGNLSNVPTGGAPWALLAQGASGGGTAAFLSAHFVTPTPETPLIFFSGSILPFSTVSSASTGIGTLPAGVFVINTAGTYRIAYHAHLKYQASDDEASAISLRVNDATASDAPAIHPWDHGTQSAVAILTLAAGDIIFLQNLGPSALELRYASIEIQLLTQP